MNYNQTTMPQNHEWLGESKEENIHVCNIRLRGKSVKESTTHAIIR